MTARMDRAWGGQPMHASRLRLTKVSAARGGATVLGKLAAMAATASLPGVGRNAPRIAQVIRLTKTVSSSDITRIRAEQKLFTCKPVRKYL